MGFSGLGLKKEIEDAFSGLGFSGPSEIQRLSAPAILAGKNIYMSSATGSGKTFAYLAPILTVMGSGTERKPEAIIATPSHDLAAQVYRECQKLIAASGLGIGAALFLGSEPLFRQLRRLRDRPRIIIGSAGRMGELLATRQLDSSALRFLVLDEGDRLFEKESMDTVRAILDHIPGGAQRLLVSASIPERTIERSKEWFPDAERLFLDPALALRENIEHWCFHSTARGKIDFLRRFHAAINPQKCLIFTSSNASLNNVLEKLRYHNINIEPLKADHQSFERKNVLDDFAEGRLQYLISTDLGARGLDIIDISHVICFDLPEEPSVYIHRAGRTGRAGRRGVSVILADLVELKRASKIAVRFGFAFKCKRLFEGKLAEMDPESFFMEAEKKEGRGKGRR